jgi:hypothetical protein
MAAKRTRTEKTMFGTVKTDVLDEMWESFDTMQILDAVGVVDSIGRRTGYNEESIRNDLLKLHAMAHTVINQADPTIGEDDQTVYELADELSPARCRRRRSDGGRSARRTSPGRCGA